MQKGGPKPMSPRRRQREFLEIASAFLDKGLKHDEAKEYPSAVTCYQRGIEVLQEGLAQTYAPDALPSVENVNTVMKRHLVNFSDRLATLQVLAREPPKPPKPPPRTESAGTLSKLFRVLWVVISCLICGIGKWICRLFQRRRMTKPKTPTAPPAPPPPPPPADEQLSRLQFSFRSASTNADDVKTAVPKAVEDRPSRAKPAPKAMPTASPATRVKATTPAMHGPVSKAAGKKEAAGPRPRQANSPDSAVLPLVKRLEKAGVDPKLLDQVLSSIIPREDVRVRWEDVTGLEDAKQALYEAAILPLQRPDLFTGLRAPARGILLFGPPGTGKTYLAKACAHTVHATFFSLSASTLTSKYVGEGEKLVKAVFMAAHELQPSIVFVDEIDSLLTARSDSENESSRRLKTEFMVQMEGLSGGGEAKNVLILGATNRPYELDEAVLRRFPKRLFIPLPDTPSREKLFLSLVGQEFSLSPADIRQLAKATDGYSNSDITHVCREASMVPIRELGAAAASIPLDKVRRATKADFLTALKSVRPSASEAQLKALQNWSTKYGSG